MFEKKQKKLFRFSGQEREVILEALNEFYRAELVKGQDFPEILEMVQRVKALTMQGDKYELWLHSKDDFDIVRKSLDEMILDKKAKGKPYDKTLDIFLKVNQAPTLQEIRKEKAQQSRGERT